MPSLPGAIFSRNEGVVIPRASEMADKGPTAQRCVCIRKATLADLPRVVDIYNQHVDSGQVTADTARISTDSRIPWFLSAICCLVAEVVDASPAASPRILGWATLHPFVARPAYASMAEIAMYTDSAAGRQGIGKTLVAALIDLSFSHFGLESVASKVQGTNAASIALHRLFGFEVWGRLPLAIMMTPTRTRRDILIMGMKTPHATALLARRRRISNDGLDSGRANGGRCVVVGSGVFGLTAALELALRGSFAEVLLLESSERIPGEGNSSNDVSRVVRADYGANMEITAAALLALDRWRRKPCLAPFFQENGVMMINDKPWTAGCMEEDCFLTLRSCFSVDVDRKCDWSAAQQETFRRTVQIGRWRDGYYNPVGGYCRASDFLHALCLWASQAGVRMRSGADVQRCILEPVVASSSSSAGGPGPARHVCRSVVLSSGETIGVDHVVLATGPASSNHRALPVDWALLQQAHPTLPNLSDLCKITAHPLFYFDCSGCEDRVQLEKGPIICPDMTETGFYIFPVIDGVLKIGHHGPGLGFDMPAQAYVSDSPKVREHLEAMRPRFENIVGRVFQPHVVQKMKIARSRLCCYCDTFDESFLIDRLPGCCNITIATGGSGHAFKFAPVLGEIIANVVEGRTQSANPIVDSVLPQVALSERRLEACRRQRLLLLPLPPGTSTASTGCQATNNTKTASTSTPGYVHGDAMRSKM